MPGPEALVIREAGSVTRLVLQPDDDGHVALDDARTEALERQLDAIDSACRVVVLTSACEEFCRGLDLGFVLETDAAGRRRAGRRLSSCLTRIASLPQPVVAVIGGPTIGGGLALAAAADLVIAAESATFQLPELCLGLTPAIVTAVACRRVRPSVLRCWTLTGMVVEADAARDAGLVDRVVPVERLEAELRGVLKHLLRTRPKAVATFKADLGAHLDARALEAALERTIGILDDPALRDDLRAFLDGETPSWFERLEPPS